MAGPAPIISGRFQLKLSEPSCIGSLHRTRHLRLQSRMENELYSGSTVDCRSEVTSQPHWLNWLLCGWSIPLYGQCFSTSELLPGIVIFFLVCSVNWRWIYPRRWQCQSRWRRPEPMCTAWGCGCNLAISNQLM